MTTLSPIPHIFKSDIRQEPRYCDSLATAMGIPFVKMTLDRPDIKGAVEQGIFYEGKQWYPSGAIAASKGDTPVFIGYEQPGFWQKIMPNHEKVAYERILHTPLWEGVQLVTVAVQVVEDGDDRFTADGQFAVSYDFCAKTGNLKEQVAQMRGAFFDVQDGEVFGEKVLLKGVGVPTLLHNVDMLVPKSCLKGDVSSLPDFFIVQMWIGISQYAKQKSARVGYQVMQYAPKTFWQAAEDLKDTLVKSVNDKTSNPARLISSTPVEDDNSPIGILKKMLVFSEKLGNTNLLKSAWATRQLQTMVSNENTDLCVSGGLKATARMAICNPSLPDFVVAIRDGKQGPGMVYRNPHTAEFVNGKLVSGMIPVKVVVDKNVPEGCIAINENTARITGLDFDGDDLNAIYANESWLSRIWFNHLEERKMISKSSTRADKNTAPESLAATLAFISNLNIGRVANIDSDLEVARQAGLITPKDYIELKKVTSQAIHDAVDGQKRFSLPDMDKMEEIAKHLRRLGVTKKETAFRAFSNGTLKGWMRNPQQDDLPKGLPLIPSNYMGDKSFIAQNFHRFAPYLNVPEFEQIGNFQFLNWLEEGQGKGANFTKVAYMRFRQIRQAIMAFKDEESFDSMKADLNHAWKKIWNECELTEQEKVEAMKALWHLSFAGDNEQSLLWNALPDLIFQLLENRIEQIKKIDTLPIEKGVLVGKALDGVFKVIKIEPTINKAGEQCQAFTLKQGDVTVGTFITRASGGAIKAIAPTIICKPLTKATALFQLV